MEGGDCKLTKSITLKDKNNKNIFFKSLKEAADYLLKNQSSEAYIKETLEPPIILKKPKIINNNRLETISEIIYQIEKKGDLDILKAIYPMDYKDMRPIGDIDTIVFHHTGNKEDYSIPRILQIQVGNTGWAAIGYHYVIDKAGLIIQTRPLKYEGAQVYGSNPGKIGIAFSTNLNEKELSCEMSKTYQDLLQYLQNKYKVPRQNIYGHCQFRLSMINDRIKSALPDIKGIDVNEFLATRTSQEFKQLKIRETKRLIKLVKNNKDNQEELKRAISMLKRTYSCPGVKFYKELQGIRAGPMNKEK